jgi:hypothetical protein
MAMINIIIKYEIYQNENCIYCESKPLVLQVCIFV